MPIIQSYISRISPPSGRETVPMTNIGAAAAPAEAVAGIGGAISNIGKAFL